MNDTLENSGIDARPPEGPEDPDHTHNPEIPVDSVNTPIPGEQVQPTFQTPAEEAESPPCDPRLLAGISGVGVQLERIMREVEQAREQIGFLPPQLRSLGSRIDAAAVSITETRYRALLLDLLGVYDLTDQLIRTLASDDNNTLEKQHLKNYQMIKTQLLQILSLNGLEPILTEGLFDESIHKAVDRMQCKDPDEAGRVTRVIRPGFRTAHQVLRYAEVVVSVHEPSMVQHPPEQALNDKHEPDETKPMTHK